MKENKRFYDIEIRGCDDVNKFEMKLTDAELEFLKRFSEVTVEHSQYSCQPTMFVEEVQMECCECGIAIEQGDVYMKYQQDRYCDNCFKVVDGSFFTYGGWSDEDYIAHADDVETFGEFLQEEV